MNATIPEHQRVRGASRGYGVPGERVGAMEVCQKARSGANPRKR